MIWKLLVVFNFMLIKLKTISISMYDRVATMKSMSQVTTHHYTVTTTSPRVSE